MRLRERLAVLYVVALTILQIATFVKKNRESTYENNERRPVKVPLVAEPAKEEPKKCPCVCKTNSTNKWQAIFNGLLVLVGIGQICVYIVQEKVMSQQAEISDNQLRESQFEQRPWVYADISPDKSFYVSQTGGLALPVNFVFHNIGHLPASYVHPIAELFLGSSTEALGEQNRLCGAIEAGKHSDLGDTVFPGQTSVGMGVSVGITKKDWDEGVIRTGEVVGIIPSVIGCIDYEIFGDPKHHQTGFAFFAAVKTKDAPNSWSPRVLPADPTKMAVEDLAFVPFPARGLFNAN